MTRRLHTKPIRVALMVLAVASVTVVVATGQNQASREQRQQTPAPPALPEYRRTVPWGPVPEDPMEMPPGYTAWNRDVKWEMGRIAVNTKGDRLYAFRRSDPPILQLDPATGKILKEFGAGMIVWAHGMYIDKDNNVWVTDATVANTVPELAKQLKPALQGGYGHQVFKFSPDGKVLLTLGTKGQAGESPTLLNAPADVVVAKNGDIFVADGHVGTRIAKFDRTGKFLKTWGTKGSGPGQFSQPHSIALDSRGRVFVGDRGNARIQIFDQEGNFLGEYRNFGNPSGIAITPDETMYVTETDPRKMVVYVGSAKDGSVLGTIPDIWAEGVSVDKDHTVYAAEVYRRNLKKFVFSKGAASN